VELPARALTFIVRVTPADIAGIAGTVERVRTGEKHRFRGLDSLGALIVRMVTQESGRAGARETTMKNFRTDRGRHLDEEPMTSSQHPQRSTSGSTTSSGLSASSARTSPLPTRRLGRSGIDVTMLSLGGAGLGDRYGPVSDEDAVQTIHRAFELGINCIDNSPSYGPFERRLGSALAALGGLPTGVYLCTKTGMHPERYEDYSAAATRWTVEGSLRTLGLDSIDLVQVHGVYSVDMDTVLAPGGTVDELERLRGEGKVRAIGLAVYGRECHRRAIASRRFDFILTHDDYSLVRQTDAPLLEEAAAAGVGVLLGRVLLLGLLAGDDPLATAKLATHPDAPTAHEWWRWARERQVPLQAVAIQFAMRHPGVSSVLIGARSVDEVEKNVAAATFPIPDEIWAEVEERIRKPQS
jgi:aryl-alcohol dehydrogenase-like predicted oxidoreductase